MISLSVTELAFSGGLMVVSSYLIRSRPDKLDTTARKITYGLLKVLRLTGFAALAATVILIATPFLKPSDLTAEDLNQLNERIEQYHAWLERSWILLLGLTGSLLAALWFGWFEVTTAQAKAAGRVVKVTSSAKVIVAILSCCTFVGAGFEDRVTARENEANAAEAKLRELQVQLFSRIKQVIERELITDWLRDASSQSPPLRQAIAAYSVVLPFLADRPAYLREADQADQRKSNDVAQLPPDGQIPDISLAQAEQLKAELDKDSSEGTPQNALMEDIVHLTYDNTVSEAVKTYLLHIGNPLLSEIGGAFLDPVVSEPAEKFIRAQTEKILKSRFDKQSLQSQVRNEANTIASAIVDRISHADESTGPVLSGLGDPRWEAVRSELRRAVAIGVRNKPAEVQDEARASVARFDAVWSAVDVLIIDDNQRQKQPERIFSNYVRKNPDFAALWGYAVISFVPDDYRDELEQIAINRGPSSEQLAALRDLVQMGSNGNAKAQNTVDKVDPEHKLTLLSQDSDYRQVWFAYDGVHPVDGFVLYHKKIGDESVVASMLYFRSPQVGKFVDEFCPRNIVPAE